MKFRTAVNLFKLLGALALLGLPLLLLLGCKTPAAKPQTIPAPIPIECGEDPDANFANSREFAQFASAPSPAPFPSDYRNTAAVSAAKHLQKEARMHPGRESLPAQCGVAALGNLSRTTQTRQAAPDGHLSASDQPSAACASGAPSLTSQDLDANFTNSRQLAQFASAPSPAFDYHPAHSFQRELAPDRYARRRATLSLNHARPTPR